MSKAKTTSRAAKRAAARAEKNAQKAGAGGKIPQGPNKGKTEDERRAADNSKAGADEVARRRHEPGAPDPEGDGPDVGRVDNRPDTASETQQIPRPARPLTPTMATVAPIAKSDGSDLSLNPDGSAKRPWKKVRALKMGFFNNKRMRAGDVFFIFEPEQYSGDWMEYAGASDPEKVTTGNEELRRLHDNVMKEKAREAGPDRDDARTNATGNENPLGAE